jgi:hypothetical protein
VTRRQTCLSAVISSLIRFLILLPYIMSSEIGTSILDAAIACIGNRISAILFQSGEKDGNYITSLHNEVVRNLGTRIRK